MEYNSDSDPRQPIAMTIAGSDSGSGAGVQADLKTFAAHGVYGATVLTLVTAQSTSSVDAVHVLPKELVIQQLDTVNSDFVIGSAKTGALGSREMIRAVARWIEAQPLPNLVVDPVMISKHGHTLLEPDAIDALRGELLPLASVVTPNLPEAHVLSRLREGSSRDWMLEAAGEILRYGCKAVILKGGHRSVDAVDLLLTADGPVWLEGERLDNPHTHGTGCTYSAALTALLLNGMELATAAAQAKHYVAQAIRRGEIYGRGVNPVNHFWPTQGTHR